MPASRPMTSKDACALLGLTGPADGEALKSAFRRAAKAARPDHDGGDETRLRRVIEAYRLLQALETARAAMPAARASVAPGPRVASEPAPTFLEISPAEAVLGLARRIKGGYGRTLGLRLPPGLRHGETVRLAGQGEDGADLILTVKVQPQGGLRVIGDDLWLEWPVEPALLSHGGRLKVASPRGEHAVTAPPALPEPYRLRLKDQGLPARAGKAQGHLFLTLKPMAAARPDPVADQLGRFKRSWMRRG